MSGNIRGHDTDKVREEVEIIQDLVALAPYRDIECVKAPYRILTARRYALRDAYMKSSREAKCKTKRK